MYASTSKRESVRQRCVDLLNDASLSESPLLRAHAIEGMLHVPEQAPANVLVGLSDPNAGVRFVSAMSAGDLQMEQSAPGVRALLSDPDVRVRAAAMYALTAMRQPVDLSPLSTWLLSRDPHVRSEVARVLGKIGNPSAVPMLRTAAARPPSAERGSLPAERLFQLQVAEAIVRLGARDEADSIRAALYPSDREGFEAAVLAAQILGEIRDDRAIAQLVDLIEQRVPDSPESPDPRNDRFLQPPELRLAAARSLAQMGHPGGMYVAEMYQADRDPVRRSQASFVYGASGQVRYLDPLSAMLDDESPLVQIAAATATLELLETQAMARADDPG